MPKLKEVLPVTVEEVRRLFEALLLEYSAKERLSELVGLLRRGIPSSVLSRAADAAFSRDGESDMDLRFIIDFLPDAVLVIDQRGRVTRWNRAMEELTGVPASDMLGKGDYEYAIPFYGERRPILIDLVFMPPGKIEKNYVHVARRGHVIEGEARIPDLRGREARLLGVAAPLFDPSGRLLGAVETIRDITGRRRAESALVESERVFRSIFEAMDDIYCRTDREDRVSMINPSGVRKLGCASEDEVLGKRMRDLVASPSDMRGLLGELRDAGRIQDRELELVRADGTLLPASVSCRVLLDDAGNEVGVEGILRDITERRRNRELDNARLAAEAANTAKTEFLASMSHEIRTPLNAVLGMAELLSEAPLGEDEKKYVRILHNAGQGLLGVVNDILDLSKVEAGRIELENIRFELPGLVESACEIMAVSAHEKGLDVRVDISLDTPSMVIGDPGRLKQVLVNLLGNGIKFTDRGEIEVCVGPSTEPGAIEFSVRDTGVGIPEDVQGIIFDRFAQADSAVPRTRGGTWLGLAICRRLVELMGGRIGVRSESGRGSTFHFTVRLGHPKDAPTFGERFFGLDGVRVLVVDDNTGCRGMRKRILESLGAAVETAADGPRALEAVRSAASSFHAVLLDADMPGMDGFETARLMRELTGTASNILFLFTTLAGEPEFARAAALGAGGRLIKPAFPADVHARLLGLMGKETGIGAGGRKSAREKTRPLDILLVEDNENNQLLFSHFLKGTPHRVEIAENGLSGVEKCLTGRWDMVFMDIEMPVMTGLEAASAIRAHEEENGLEHVPIIALSAHALPGMEMESCRAGCTGYLSKPFNKAQLLDMLDDYSR